MSGDQIGFHFALFAMTVFVVAPFATNWMSRNGALHTYRRGLCIISVATSFALGSTLHLRHAVCALDEHDAHAARRRRGAGGGVGIRPHLQYCALGARLALHRHGRGLHRARLHARSSPGRIAFLGRGFAAPFCLLGSALLLGLPVLRFLSVREHKREADADGGSTAPPRNIRGLLRLHPSIGLLALACVLANSDYALLEPTLGDYAIAEGVVGIEGAAAEIGPSSSSPPLRTRSSALSPAGCPV